MLYKEISNSNGQQFQQYQQNGKKPFSLQSIANNKYHDLLYGN